MTPLRLKFMKIKLFLVVILFISAILRLWNLGGNPPGLTPDEAALGYNAYSILKTGRDEYGQILPVVFKSFGDYKPELYVYLTVPSVAIFGLTEFAVRFPSALSGILIILLIYKIITLLTAHYRTSIAAAIIAALNPWLITFSRGAWEANITLTLTLAGIYFFLRALKEPFFMIYSSSFFSLTLLTYQGAKFSTAIVVAIFVLAYFKDLIKLPKKTLGIAGLVGLLISLPIIFSIFQGKAGRLEVFTIFSYPRPLIYTQNFLDEGQEKLGSPVYYLFHSETFNYARGIMGRWFNHFSGKFLFFEGDYASPRHSPPNMGVLLNLELILLILGFVYLVNSKEKFKWFILPWLLLAPLPAVLSRDQVNAVRSINMVVPLILISAFGTIYLFEMLGRFKLKTLFCVVFCLFYILNFVYFLDSYFIHQPLHNAKYWYYGYKQVVNKVWLVRDNYKKTVIQQSYNQPYIYFLFYTRFDPARYQKQANLVLSGPDVGLVDYVDNVEFKNLNLPDLRNQNNYLIVADYAKIPDEVIKGIPEFRLLEDIDYRSGDVAFRIIETK